MRTLPADAFIAESGASPEVIAKLVEVGTIVPLGDGRFDAADEVVASTAQALLEAGISLDDLSWSLSSSGFGFRSVRGYVSEPSPRVRERYAELVASLGDAGRLVPDLYAALGLPEPAPDDHPRVEEAAVVRSFAELWYSLEPSGDGHVRAARLVGEAVRRVAEGWADLWDEIAQPNPATQGAPTAGRAPPTADPGDPDQNPAIRMSEVSRQLVAFAYERRLETTLHGRVIWAIEQVLEAAGRMPSRERRPSAVAFVDLAGFTTLTERLGDLAAARAATRLHEVAEHELRRSGGRVVKQLGDGVLLRFRDPAQAIDGVRSLIASLRGTELPPAHAGIAAGPVVVRDGDVFGGTVNLAARLAATAPAGEVWVEEGMVVALPAGTASFEPVGRLELAGLASPVAVWRLGLDSD